MYVVFWKNYVSIKTQHGPPASGLEHCVLWVSLGRHCFLSWRAHDSLSWLILIRLLSHIWHAHNGSLEQQMKQIKALTSEIISSDEQENPCLTSLNHSAVLPKSGLPSFPSSEENFLPQVVLVRIKGDSIPRSLCESNNVNDDSINFFFLIAID